jgi:hypothetical protein
MQREFEKDPCAVRFSTEKSVCFTALNAIFDRAKRRDSFVRCGRGGGMPRIQVELSRC